MLYKGASLIKYFYYTCGEELFFKGIKEYISNCYNKTSNYNDFQTIFDNLIVKAEVISKAKANLENNEIIKTTSASIYQSPIVNLNDFLTNKGIINLETV